MSVWKEYEFISEREFLVFVEWDWKNDSTLKRKTSRKPEPRSLNALYVSMNLAIKLLQRFLVTLLLLNRCARFLHLKKLVFCGNPHSRGLNGVTL